MTDDSYNKFKGMIQAMENRLKEMVLDKYDGFLDERDQQIQQTAFAFREVVVGELSPQAIKPPVAQIIVTGLSPEARTMGVRDDFTTFAKVVVFMECSPDGYIATMSRLRVYFGIYDSFSKSPQARKLDGNADLVYMGPFRPGPLNEDGFTTFEFDLQTVLHRV